MSGPTRREALAALAATAAAGTMPAVALANVPNRSAWDAAMRRYEQVKAQGKIADERWHRAADAYEDLTGYHPLKRGPWRPLDEATARLTGYTQAEHAADELSQREGDCASALVEMPAPDGQALLWKIEHLYGEDGRDSENYGPSYCAKWIDALLSDARRLLTTGRA